MEPTWRVLLQRWLDCLFASARMNDWAFGAVRRRSDWRWLSFELSLCDFRLHEQSAALDRDCHQLPGLEPHVSPFGFVEAVGICERILRPGHDSQAVANRFCEHIAAAESRQIEILSEIISKLRDRHMIPPPEWYAV